MTTSRHIFPALDAMRGLAALAVVLFHFARVAAPGVAPSGHLAVDLFFLMSGFVIAQAYGRKLLNPGGFVGFVRTRVIRLWPLHLLGVAIGVAFYMKGEAARAGQGAFAASAALHALMLPTPQGWLGLNSLFPFNIAAWSLFFEMAVNLVYAVLAPWLSTRRLILAAAGFGALLVVGVLGFGSAGVGAAWDTFWLGFPRVGFSFTLGVLVQRLWADGKLRLQAPSAFLAAAIVALMAVIFHTPPGLEGRATHELVAIVVAWPALLVMALNIQAGALAQRVSAWAGEVSYPLYALHIPLALWISRETHRHWPYVGDDPMRLMIVKIGAILLAAWAATALFDRPVRARLGGLGRARRPLAGDAVEARG